MSQKQYPYGRHDQSYLMVNLLGFGTAAHSEDLVTIISYCFYYNVLLIINTLYYDATIYITNFTMSRLLFYF
jgi:hypothetical protein